METWSQFIEVGPNYRNVHQFRNEYFVRLDSLQKTKRRLECKLRKEMVPSKRDILEEKIKRKQKEIRDLQTVKNVQFTDSPGERTQIRILKEHGWDKLLNP